MNEEPENKGLSLTFFVLMWVVLFALAALFFDNLIGERHNPNSAPVSRQNGEQREVILQRNRQGHFITTGFANNSEMVFMVDTGATDVVLSEASARRASLKRGQGGFASTANGVITVYDTTIASLRVGNITLRNVKASINPHMDDDYALLGMSFLSQLEMLQKGDTLTFSQ